MHVGSHVRMRLQWFLRVMFQPGWSRRINSVTLLEPSSIIGLNYSDVKETIVRRIFWSGQEHFKLNGDREGPIHIRISSWP
jgi:hypothetical protein